MRVGEGSPVEMCQGKNGRRRSKEGAQAGSVSGNSELRGITPSPPLSERLDWRGFCKKYLQNLEGAGVTDQNLDNKRFTGFSCTRCAVYLRLDHNLLIAGRGSRSDVTA